MGGDLIPLPLVRLRGRTQEGCWRLPLVLFEESGYDLPVKVKVRSRMLGSIKMGLSVVAFILMAVYLVFVEKSYLMDNKIEGYSRVTLQHPVEHCNPLHAHCKAALSPFDDLSYCSGSRKHVGVSGGKRIGCKYLDTFDLYKFNNGLSLGNILVPTRLSTFKQKENPACALPNKQCTHPYSILSEDHNFVADIEDFTLLIDHGFECPNLGLSEASWSMLGFYLEKPVKHTRVTQIIGAVSNNQKNKRFYIPCIGKSEACGLQSDDSKLNTILSNYDTDISAKGDILSTKYGDIVKVSTLFKIAGIDLDKRNFGGKLTRDEGEAIVIEIDYNNYRHFHWPNNLKPTYEYRIYHMPADTFKVTHVEEEGKGLRKVLDVHGVHILTRSTGRLGSFSIKQSTLAFVEMSIALGIVHWILHCCVINWEKSDNLLRKVESNYSMKDDELLAAE